jgi:hypothetical protein
MKIREVISEAPAVQKVMNKFAAPSQGLAYQAGQKTAQVGSAIGNFFTKQPEKDKVSAAGAIGGALDQLNTGAKPTDFSKKGLDTEKFNDFASLLVTADPKNKANILAAMQRILQKDPNTVADTQDKNIIIAAIKELSQTKNLEFSKGEFNSDYRAVLQKLDIGPESIPGDVTNPQAKLKKISAPGTAAAKAPGTGVNPAQGI